ncbi:MAG: response regulator [Myxococcales bacterium]|nr:response regulator [Myxococcales bacterium]
MKLSTQAESEFDEVGLGITGMRKMDRTMPGIMVIMMGSCLPFSLSPLETLMVAILSAIYNLIISSLIAFRHVPDRIAHYIRFVGSALLLGYMQYVTGPSGPVWSITLPFIATMTTFLGLRDCLLLATLMTLSTVSCLWLTGGSGEMVLAASISLASVSVLSTLSADFTKTNARMLVQATQARANFLAAVSHEMRTPLNGVIGVSQLLEDTNLSKSQREHVHTIIHSGRLLVSLINDILDYTKIGENKMIIDHSPLFIGESIENVCKSLHPAARENRNTLLCSIDASVPKIVYGDVTRIEQITHNLVGNAIKFTKEGHVRVAVTSPKNGWIRLEVKDTGVGIDAGHLPSLFEPFCQGDTSTTRKYGGTGLGLAIVKSIVKLMNGKISVQSQLGRGSSFCVELPLPQGDRVQTADITSGKLRLKSSLAGLLPRVLLIKSDGEQRKLYTRMIQTLGYRVVAVGSEDETLRALQKNDYGLIIIDDELGGLDLDQMISRVRSNLISTKKQSIMVIATDEKLRNLSIDVDIYMSKPAEKRMLADVLEKWYRKNIGDLPEIRATIEEARHLERPHGSVSESPVLLEPIPTLEESPSRTKDDRKDPRAQASLSESDGSSNEHEAHPAAENSQSRVMVVEDNRVNQRVLVRLVERLGFHVELAENGLEAVERFVNGKYKAILMDCEMPVMDGFEATREIRKREGPKNHVLIVAVTAQSDARGKCLAVGMDDFIGKPIDKELIAKMLSSPKKVA